jgi:hypothetical protein
VAINTELADYREKVRALKTTARERPVSNRQTLTKSRADMITLERQKMAGVGSLANSVTLSTSGGDATTANQQPNHVSAPLKPTGPWKCDTCAHVNDASRMFCGECGVRLNLALLSSSSPRKGNAGGLANASLRSSVRTQNLQQMKEEQEKTLVAV